MPATMKETYKITSENTKEKLRALGRSAFWMAIPMFLTGEPWKRSLAPGEEGVLNLGPVSDFFLIVKLTYSLGWLLTQKERGPKSLRSGNQDRRWFVFGCSTATCF